MKDLGLLKYLPIALVSSSSKINKFWLMLWSMLLMRIMVKWLMISPGLGSSLVEQMSPQLSQPWNQSGKTLLGKGYLISISEVLQVFSLQTECSFLICFFWCLAVKWYKGLCNVVTAAYGPFCELGFSIRNQGHKKYYVDSDFMHLTIFYRTVISETFDSPCVWF